MILLALTGTLSFVFMWIAAFVWHNLPLAVCLGFTSIGCGIAYFHEKNEGGE